MEDVDRVGPGTCLENKESSIGGLGSIPTSSAQFSGSMIVVVVNVRSVDVRVRFSRP